MKVEEFIGSIDNKTYNRIRSSQSDAECRRYLKEHLLKQLNILDVISTVCDCEKKVYEPLINGEVKCLRCGKMIAQTDL